MIAVRGRGGSEPRLGWGEGVSGVGSGVGWGWGQWRCPSEGHGRECGLRPSVQSGVPRCSTSLFLPRSSVGFSAALFVFLSPPVFIQPDKACSLSRSLHRAAAAQTAGMHQMHRTDRCPSRSTASTCLLRPRFSPVPPFCRSFARRFFLYRFRALRDRSLVLLSIPF